MPLVPVIRIFVCACMLTLVMVGTLVGDGAAVTTSWIAVLLRFVLMVAM